MSATDAIGLRDRDRLRAAFAALREAGYWARADQSDGWNAVPDDILRRDGKVVFWHANETPHAFNAQGDLVSPLHLHHKHRDVADIAAALRANGLTTVEQGAGDAPLLVVLPAVPDEGDGA